MFKCLFSCVRLSLGDTMNLVKEYTDVRYASKKTVKEEMGAHLFDPIWNQIESYRREYLIKIENVEFCLCPGILSKMVQFHESFYHFNFNEGFEQLIQTEEACWLYHHFLKTKGSFRKRLHELCVLYHSLDETRINDLMNESVPVMCKFIWFLMNYSLNDFSLLLCVLLVCEWNMKGLLSLVRKDDFEHDFNRDGTYLLSHLLMEYGGQIQISLIYNAEENSDFTLLSYQYPQLKKYQIEFYLNHHEPGFYYTIEQFIEYSDVCYETGRCALKQLVDLGFYQMLKLGKKFVYTAR